MLSTCTNSVNDVDVECGPSVGSHPDLSFELFSEAIPCQPPNGVNVGVPTITSERVGCVQSIKLSCSFAINIAPQNQSSLDHTPAAFSREISVSIWILRVVV